MIAFLKLIRIQNLLIIAFTQYMVRWCIIYPELSTHGFELQLSNLQFFFLSLSTVMIAAAGYAINDYFDVRIDKVNKPERMVMWKLVIFHILCATGLWLYSTTFKRKFFIGNFVIALFTAFVPLIVGIYELLPCYKVYQLNNDTSNFAYIWIPVIGISFFAFITTLLREIIKDIEDVEGDKEFGCQTMPIVLGIKNSKLIVITLIAATMICLGYIQALQYSCNDHKAFYYFLLGLQLPFVFLMTNVYKAETKNKFRFAGNTAKFIMLMGVIYLFIHSYEILTAL
ncbi:MAG: UbiA prenyltransferase [Bacteroidetes bacterium]|nr:UbiA prenyltransferase [Bacteroidota bacterium]